MKAPPRFFKPLFAILLSAFVAACGGSGGTPEPKRLNLSGTAAVGAALAEATVTVKCATGGGTTATDVNGDYTLSLADAELPCVIQVVGDAGGISVTLHSVAEQGTGSNGEVSAVANVTPLTEMIVAQLVGALPGEFFESFSSSTNITAAQLTLATGAILEALKAYTGIDVTAIDPFKATLVAASSENTGNTYDQLLDQLGEKISLESLGVVVTQIANAASNESTETNTETTTLADVMTGVDAGAMPYCPQAISGKYRVLQYDGRTYVVQIDFKNLTYNRPDGTPLFTMAPLDAAKPCEFTVAGVSDAGHSVSFTFAMGANGGGIYRIVNATTGGSSVGYIFPAQSHSIASLKGQWTLLLSGRYDGQWEHVLSRITVGNDGAAVACDYDTIENPECIDPENLTISARTDGGFSVSQVDSTSAAQAWMFVAPNGGVTLFGTNNPTGDLAAFDRTHFVATRATKLALPQVDSVSRISEAQVRVGASYSTSFSRDAITNTDVNAETSTVTRRLESNGRIDQVRYNFPIDGVRFRPAGTSVVDGVTLTFFDTLQLPLATGTLVTINTNPVSISQPHLFSLATGRP
jgi:hypothetical protein